MLPVLTAAQMREADRRTIEGGVPGATLMDQAGAAVARVVRERYPAPRRIAVLCGKGNNGGDGFAAARQASSSGTSCTAMPAVSSRARCAAASPCTSSRRPTRKTSG